MTVAILNTKSDADLPMKLCNESGVCLPVVNRDNLHPCCPLFSNGKLSYL